MKVLAVLLLAGLATALPKKNAVFFKDIKGERIINGTSAVEGQFPWQVANRFSTFGGSFFCGGSLISDGWVLTAAHCVTGAFHFEIILGSIKSSGGGVSIESTEGFPHESYNPYTLNNDIGLVKLGRKVEFTDLIQPIPLGTDRVSDATLLTVSGWGKTSDFGNISPVLMYVNLTTIPNQECEEIYTSAVVDSVVCCRGEADKSTCNGDSGGPLVQKLDNGTIVQVGVVSFGHIAGCTQGYPVGFSRTASFKGWVDLTIWLNE